MELFDGCIAVVTGGGSGMGRELVRQLSAAGCQVATCDISTANLAETKEMCDAAPGGGRVTTFVADVSDESAVATTASRSISAPARTHCRRRQNTYWAAGLGGLTLSM